MTLASRWAAEHGHDVQLGINQGVSLLHNQQRGHTVLMLTCALATPLFGSKATLAATSRNAI